MTNLIDYIGSLNRYQLTGLVVGLGVPAWLIALGLAQRLLSRGNGNTDEEGDE